MALRLTSITRLSNCECSLRVANFIWILLLTPVVVRPKYLFLHLMRFKQEDEEITKIDTEVEIEDRTSLDEFCGSDVTMSGGYLLLSVAYHRGSFGGGHYTTDSLRLISPSTPGDIERYKWIHYDDEFASQTSFGDMRRSARKRRTAYLLLYTSESAVDGKLLKSEDSPCRDDKSSSTEDRPIVDDSSVEGSKESEF